MFAGALFQSLGVMKSSSIDLAVKKKKKIPRINSKSEIGYTASVDQRVLHSHATD